MNTMLAAVIAAGVVMAPAGAAVAVPDESGNALQTIGRLEADGFDVIIDRVGTGPINQCVVTSVRNPHDITRTIWVDHGSHRHLVTVVVRRHITVSLNCDV
jgi:hypothetical protein